MIKLRKTVIVSAIYDDGVRTGDVYTVLDNRGGDQHIVFVVNEIQHYSLHLFFVHLAMADGHTRLRHETLDQGRDCVDRFDAIVNEKDLAAARQFKFDGRFDYCV